MKSDQQSSESVAPQKTFCSLENRLIFLSSSVIILLLSTPIIFVLREINSITEQIIEKKHIRVPE